MSEQTVRVFIADDHRLIIDAIKRKLIQEADLAYAGSAENEEELLRRLNDKVHVLLLDIILEEPEFLDLVQKIKNKNPHIRTLILTGKEDLAFAEACLENGACGYIAKALSLEEICGAARKAFRYQNMNIIELPNPKHVDQDRKDAMELITPRERQVISLLCKGFKNNAEIARFLTKINRSVITELTVATHRKNIRRKLNPFGITNDSSLGFWTAKWELLDGTELSTVPE